MAQVLDSLFVDITARGLDAVSGQLNAFSGVIGQVNGLINQMRQSLAMALVPVGAATAAITALSLAGLQGTVELQQLTLHFKLFAREIAGITMPIVEGLTWMFNRMWRVLSRIGADGQKALFLIVAGLIGVTVAITGVILALTAATVVVGVLTTAVSALAFVMTLASGGLNLVAAALIALTGIQFAAIGAASAAWYATLGASFAALVAYSKDLRQALYDVGMQIWQVFEAAQPLLKALAVLAGAIIKTFVIEPLIVFLGWMEKIVLVVERVAKALSGLPVVRRLAAIFDADKKPGVRPTLTGGGTETAEGTFDRFQNAALGTPETKDPLADNTDKLKHLADRIDAWIDVVKDRIRRVEEFTDKPVESLVAGAGGGFGAVGMGVGLITSELSRFMGGRK